MYISNSSNIGMATLLQNNKNCMKPLSNGTSVVGVGTAGTNHIIVGNVVTSGQQSNHQQVGSAASTNVPTQTISTTTQGTLSGSNTISALGGNLVLPAQTQTILLTNGATGASTILTYQQYQQLLQQQQQQQQQQRLLVSQNLVNLPIGNLISTGNSGLTVITDSTNNHNASSSAGNTVTTQGTFLATSSASSSFQQQFQQQISNLQNSQNVTTNASSCTTLTTPSSSYLQQSGSQQQQRLITTTAVGNAVNNNNGNNTTTIRHFSQFSQQQQPANTLNVITNSSAAPNNSNTHQTQQRTTTVLINRNSNTIIAGNATQRLQHATILTKSPANVIKTSQPHHQGTIMVNNMAVQQVINNTNGQIISLVKTTQQQQQINKNLTTKSIQQTTTANLPQQQIQKQRYGTTNIQQFKQQQLKVVATNNHQTIPQRATIINSNTITKNHVLSNNNTTTKLVNLNKTTTTPNVTTIATNKNVSSNCLSKVSQKPAPQQQFINGHQFNNKLISLHQQQQQQPASKLVPNGNNTINNPNNTNKHYANSSASVSLSSSPNSIITTTSFISNSPTIHSASPSLSSKSALTNPNTSYIPTTLKNSQNHYTTSSLNSTTATTTTAHNPSNPPTTESKSVSIDSSAVPSSTTNAAISNNRSAVTANNATSASAATPPANEQQEPEPEIDIVINNVVCSFSVRCHLNLREIALNGANVEYRRENGMVTMKLRRPYTTASIWSSGRITCTGATSEEQAKIAARRYARCLEKLGFRARFHNFRVVNVLGTCSMPWAIKIVNFSEKYREEASYEPELHPGVTYKLRYPKATLKIFSTGSITVTAASVAHVQCAIEHIFPLVYEFRKKRSPEELEQLRLKQLQNATFEDITDVENVEATSSGNNLIATNARSSLVPTVSTLKRRRISNTFNKFSNAKRKRTDDINEELDIDDPEILTDICDDEDDMVMYDPNESIIEGPDDGDVL